jgi:hypothetical protein
MRGHNKEIPFADKKWSQGAAVFYLLRGSIAWRLLPVDFPPWSTVYLYGQLNCKSILN